MRRWASRPAIPSTPWSGSAEPVSLQVVGPSLVLDEVHQPAGHDDRAYKQYEAVDAVAQHRARGGPLRDAEDGRGEEREEQHGGEVGGRKGHGFLPMRI